MQQSELKKILGLVSEGKMDADEALVRIKEAPYTDLGFARIDNHRQLRQGFSEVIYGAGKSADQIFQIARTMYRGGSATILITRMNEEKAKYLSSHLEKEIPFRYESVCQIGIVGCLPEPDGAGTVVIASGGTSDMAVAEEAALTAQALGSRVVRLYDVVFRGFTGFYHILTRS